MIEYLIFDNRRQSKSRLWVENKYLTDIFANEKFLFMLYNLLSLTAYLLSLCLYFQNFLLFWLSVGKLKKRISKLYTYLITRCWLRNQYFIMIYCVYFKMGFKKEITASDKFNHFKRSFCFVLKLLNDLEVTPIALDLDFILSFSTAMLSLLFAYSYKKISFLKSS